MSVVVKEVDVRGIVFTEDFDAKYRDEPDPWNQSGTMGELAGYYVFSRGKLARLLAGRFNNTAHGLEIGCGYGYLTELLSKKFRMAGVDISPIAIKRAEVLHPGIPFEVGDVRADDFFPGSFHFVLLAQVWKYVAGDDVYTSTFPTLHNCLRCLEPNGMLVISQGFPKEGDAVGDSFDATLLLLTSIPELRLVHAEYDDTGGHGPLNDGLLMLRKIETEEE